MVNWTEIRAAFSAGRKASEQEAPTDPLFRIYADRRSIHEAIDRSARQGFVPAAFVIQLYANHQEELAEERRHIDDLDQRLEARLRLLNAQFPAPDEPEPELPAPAPPRHYPRISTMFGPGNVDTRH